MDANTKLIVIALVVALVGVGAGYGIGTVMGSDDATDYHFYLYFEEDDDRNGWYAGKGTDASAGFSKAMDGAGLEYEISGGYLSTIDEEGSWSVFNYLYNDTSEEAVQASVDEMGIVRGDYGFISTNGWVSFAGFGGYEDEDSKMRQSVSTIFFLSIFQDMGEGEWGCENPVDFNGWMDSGPFKA